MRTLKLFMLGVVNSCMMLSAMQVKFENNTDKEIQTDYDAAPKLVTVGEGPKGAPRRVRKYCVRSASVSEVGNPNNSDSIRPEVCGDHVVFVVEENKKGDLTLRRK